MQLVYFLIKYIPLQPHICTQSCGWLVTKTPLLWRERSNEFREKKPSNILSYKIQFMLFSLDESSQACSTALSDITFSFHGQLIQNGANSIINSLDGRKIENDCPSWNTESIQKFWKAPTFAKLNILLPKHTYFVSRIYTRLINSVLIILLFVC